jgi:hypothetical protein
MIKDSQLTIKGFFKAGTPVIYSEIENKCFPESIWRGVLYNYEKFCGLGTED